MPATPRILFYLGYDNDRGGICSFLRALSTASAPHFEMTLGMNAGFSAFMECGDLSPLSTAGLVTPPPRNSRAPASCCESTSRPVKSGDKSPHSITGKFAPQLPVVEFPRIAGETISPLTLLRARAVARAVREWLHAAPDAGAPRIFHGCSRAGLLVALWLARWGERRVCATIHSYGRHRWFYRHAARVLGPRLKFLSPAMAAYYGLPPQTWDECLPPCVQFLGRAKPPAEPMSRAAQPEALPYPKIRAAGIGALVRIKQWHLVLDALAQLPADIRARWQFTHIGASDGSRDSERYALFLRERTRALGLDTQVRWLGQQPSSAPLLADSDVLIVPADREAFSLARIEALAAGVPSISADSGGARDFISPSPSPSQPPRSPRPPAQTNGTSEDARSVNPKSAIQNPKFHGWLFRNNNAPDLARVLAQLSAPNALATARIDRALLHRFTPEAGAAQHADFYKKLSA